MKLLTMLMLSLVTVSTSRSTNKDHMERAAAQLNRLTPFRRVKQDKTNIIIEKWPGISNIILNENNKKLSNQSNQKISINNDIMRKIDELAAVAYNMSKDVNYNALMEERIKRSGSGDFISNIAGKVIHGVTSTSGGLSSGSSGHHQAHDSYGVPVQPYEEVTYSIWDFKKAILNTVIQALKALAGGAIAVKGHLIKGGGFIVQTTGRVISSAGEAASSLGTQIASSAVISQPKPAHGSPTGYSYDAPQNQDYVGPPPHPDATYTQHSVHHIYGAPSDAHPANEPGVLLIKAVNNDETHQYDHNENQHHDQVQHPQPNSSALEESFGGSPEKNTKTILKVSGLVTGTYETPQTNEHHEHIDLDAPEHKNQQVPSPLLNYHQLDSQNVHNHASLLSLDNDHQHNQVQTQHNSQLFPQGNLQDISINQNHQLAYQQIQSLLNPHLRLPVNEAQTFTDQTSNYGIDSTFDPLKIPIFSHQNQNAFNIENYGEHELPIGYGLPMHHGFGIAANYPSKYPPLKRIGFIPPHFKMMNTRNIVMKKPVNFRINNSMLHRV